MEQPPASIAERLAHAKAPETTIKKETIMGLDVASGLNRGRVRETQQDAVKSARIQTPHHGVYGVFVLADGMGGHRDGEKASQAAIDSVSKGFSQWQGTTNPNEDYPKDAFTLGLTQAHTAIKDISPVAAAIGPAQPDGTYVAKIMNIGDSRAYIIGKNGEIHQVTKDHSEERNKITRSLDGNNLPNPDYFEATLGPGDKLLLCSDGLWEEVNDDIIAGIVGGSSTPENAIQRLIDTANANGGHDNISALVVGVPDRNRASGVPAYLLNLASLIRGKERPHQLSPKEMAKMFGNATIDITDKGVRVNLTNEIGKRVRYTLSDAIRYAQDFRTNLLDADIRNIFLLDRTADYRQKTHSPTLPESAFADALRPTRTDHLAYMLTYPDFKNSGYIEKLDETLNSNANFRPEQKENLPPGKLVRKNDSEWVLTSGGKEITLDPKALFLCGALASQNLEGSQIFMNYVDPKSRTMYDLSGGITPDDYKRIMVWAAEKWKQASGGEFNASYPTIREYVIQGESTRTTMLGYTQGGHVLADDRVHIRRPLTAAEWPAIDSGVTSFPSRS